MLSIRSLERMPSVYACGDNSFSNIQRASRDHLLSPVQFAEGSTVLAACWSQTIISTLSIISASQLLTLSQKIRTVAASYSGWRVARLTYPLGNGSDRIASSLGCDEMDGSSLLMDLQGPVASVTRS